MLNKYTRMNPGASITTRFTLVTDEEFHKILKLYARKNKTTVSQLIRSVMFQWIENEKKKETEE